jgi:16S rRNA (cytosine1402-N4)-methyltransferase
MKLLLNLLDQLHAAGVLNVDSNVKVIDGDGGHTVLLILLHDTEFFRLLQLDIEDWVPMSHIPVLLEEVVEAFAPCHLRTVLDGTCGAGGHARALLESHPEIEHYVACDQDTEALALAKASLEGFASKVSFHHTNFSSPPTDPLLFDAILLDLGVSSMQLDRPERGFSFLREGPLDMRMDLTGDLLAEDIVNRWDRRSLERIFREYGEEPKAKRAVEAIVETRRRHPFHTTTQLAEVIATVLPRRGRLHPATQIFQALRIAVNRELDVLTAAIPLLAHRLSDNGRMLVITFHSLEDRIVKNEFRTLAKGEEYSLLWKKPLAPSLQEARRNPRARSAKLRGLVKMPHNGPDQVLERRCASPVGYINVRDTHAPDSICLLRHADWRPRRPVHFTSQ